MKEPAAGLDRFPLVVGIDPGQHTGCAMYNRVSGTLREVFTADFWRVRQYVLTLPADQTLVVIEWPAGNAVTFRGKGKSRQNRGETAATREKSSRDVGGNMREAELLARGLEEAGYTVVRKTPTKGSQTKLDAPTFERVTGWTARTNEHGRDAGMLCFQHSGRPL
jgi:hypothetical protein